MAAKTPAQVISQLQSYVAADRIIRYLMVWLGMQVDLIDTEIATGDKNQITEAQQVAMRQLMSAAETFYGQSGTALRSITATLGELADSPSPGADPDADLAFLHDYLITNSKAVPTRGFTKAAWAADGGNTGTGRILQLKTDVAADDIDCAHPEPSYRMRVIKSAGRGVQEGREPFEIIGTKVDRAWQDDGVGNQPVYASVLGKGINDLAADQQRVRGLGLNTTAFESMCGNSNLNLLGTNGAFETAVQGTGVSKYNGITFISGQTNASEETTAPLVGNQSMKVDGNMVFYMPLNQQRLTPGSALSLGFLVEKVIASSTLTGTLTAIFRSGGDKDVAAQGTGHGTITVTIGSLSDNAPTAQDLSLIVPEVIGADPRIEFTLTSYSDGSGTSNNLLLDEFYAGQMYQLDMGQFILPVRGVTPWEYNDRWTSSVTDLKAASDDGVGAVQEFINRRFGRYLKHSAAGTDWVDPTLAPEITVRSSVDGSTYAAHTDGGQVAHGTDPAGAVSFYMEIANDGNYPLSVGIPVESGASNCSITGGKNTAPLVIMPGHKYLLTITVTITGAGAYAITLTFATNDSSEATYEIDLVGTGS